MKERIFHIRNIIQEFLDIKSLLCRSQPRLSNSAALLKKAIQSVGRRINYIIMLNKRKILGNGSLPDFLIIGAQKAGTTTLFYYLTKSPQILAPLRKEIHYFDQLNPKALSWYRAHFPSRHELISRGCITGEATPFYIFHPEAPYRIAAAGLSPKIVAILRRPDERAFSHWRHERRKGREMLSFVESIEVEPKRLHYTTNKVLGRAHLEALRRYSYFNRGLYDRQLQKYAEVFGREKLLIITLDSLSLHPYETIIKVCNFLQISAPNNINIKVMNKGQQCNVAESEIALIKKKYYKEYVNIREWIGDAWD